MSRIVRTTRKQQAAGWVLFEAVIGMACLSLAITCMIMMANESKHATRAMAARRDAARKADRMLWERLQAKEQENIKLEQAAGGYSPPGYSWKKVTVTVDGQTRSVFGMTSDRVGGPGGPGKDVEGGDGPMARK